MPRLALSVTRSGLVSEAGGPTDADELKREDLADLFGIELDSR